MPSPAPKTPVEPVQPAVPKPELEPTTEREEAKSLPPILETSEKSSSEIEYVSDDGKSPLSSSDYLLNPHDIETALIPLEIPDQPSLSNPYTNLFNLTDMAEHGDMEEVPVNRTTTDKIKEKELGIKKPEPYNGDLEKWQTFWDSVLLYTSVNAKHYKEATKYIGFVLSYMTEGSTAAWRRNYIKAHVLPTGHLLFPSTNTFNEEIQKEFEPTFSKEDALELLKSLRQGNTPIDNHNITFKGLVAQAGIKGETVNIISLYQDSIRMPLLAKILLNEEPGNLVTIEDWYNKVTQHEKQWLHLKQIQERFRGHRGSNNDYRNNNNNRYQGTKKFTPQMRTWRNYAGGSNNNQRNSNSYRP